MTRSGQVEPFERNKSSIPLVHYFLTSKIYGRGVQFLLAVSYLFSVR